MRQIEVNGNNQKQLEVDEKTKSIMNTKEEFKRRCIDYMLEMRKGYIHKLHDIRKGCVFE